MSPLEHDADESSSEDEGFCHAMTNFSLVDAFALMFVCAAATGALTGPQKAAIPVELVEARGGPREAAPGGAGRTLRVVLLGGRQGILEDGKPAGLPEIEKVIASARGYETLQLGVRRGAPLVFDDYVAALAAAQRAGLKARTEYLKKVEGNP